MGARDGDPALDAVQFVSASHGWVAGAGWIVTTADGGRTWSTQLQTDQHFRQVDFVSATTGFAVGGTELLGTTDGGRCWVRLGEPNPPLASVHFVSPTTGWGVAATTNRGTGPATMVPGGGTLVRTTDGGRSWTPVSGAPANAQSVCFIDATDGWLGADGRIFATHDGGSRWQQVADPSRVAGRTTGADLETVQCAAPSGVWVVSDTDNGAAGTVPWATFASPDGRHFREVDQAMYGGPSNVPVAPGSYPGVTSAIDARTAAIVAFTPAREPQSAAMALATAGGARVSPTRLLPAMQDATGAAFVSPTTGWVVGDAAPSGSGRRASTGLVAATSNGGRTWTIQYRTP
ncbi:MAG TPA: YCF48-related protein [Acidimicrobiales bacterium]|nr:YCF48-related protein [Acidimicrobiales bacterium]